MTVLEWCDIGPWVLPSKNTSFVLPVLEIDFCCHLFLLFNFPQCCTRAESDSPVAAKVRLWLFPPYMP